MASTINIISIVLDAMTIGMYYGEPGANSFNNFMVITNLLLRPITSLVLLRIYNERAGRFSSLLFPGIPGFDGTGGLGSRGSYEDLDVGRGGGGIGRNAAPPTHQSVPPPPRATEDSRIISPATSP